LRDQAERFREVGAAVVLVGLGRPEQARDFCQRRRVPFACVVRPDRAVHRAYGLRRGNLNQLAGPRVWAPWLRDQVTGKHQGRFGQGDAAQLPGTFVVDTEGVIRFAHRGRRSNDNPSNDDILGALASLREGKETG
jgi:peroxiredoxin